MPQVRYYTVVQEREVKVRANSLIEAVGIASLAFDEDNKVVGGPILKPVRQCAIIAREDK